MKKGKKEALKKEERVKLIEKLKDEISLNLGILRRIKTDSPQESSSPYHRFHFNIAVFSAQRDYILGKLSEKGVTLEDIGRVKFNF